MTHLKSLLTFLLISLLTVAKADSTKVFVFDMKEEIAQPIWRSTQIAFDKAEAWGADVMIIDMDTYGGAVDMADSIRTKILRSEIPVYVLINNNAASAGALISLACDKIYMMPGSTIGAATVVDQSGQAVPDKYQSYMRSKMRATAEENGRDPDIAEAMVDPDKVVENISEKGKVLTFTTEEAILHGFADGEALNIKEVIEKEALKNVVIEEYHPETVDNIIGWLISPAISGLLIMIMIGGIYFELQSPGIGFPIVASLAAAILYFAPYYLEGMVENWELIVFIVGIILLFIEAFVTPGFGVLGGLGVTCLVFGLALAMIDNDGLNFEVVGLGSTLQAFTLVIVSTALSFSIIIFMLKPSFFEKGPLAKIVVTEKQGAYKDTEMIKEVTVPLQSEAIAHTDLRPAGKIKFNNVVYDAVALTGYIEKGKKVIVTDHQAAQNVVREVS